MQHTDKIILNLKTAEILIDTYNCSAHLKELNSGKYVLSNISNLKVFGMNAPEDILGLTLRDMDSFMAPFWGKNANEVAGFDAQILKTEQTVSDMNRAWLNAKGHIWRHNMIKFPVMSEFSNKIAYVFTVSTTVDTNIRPLKLFELYRLYYQDPIKLVTYFLSHLRVLEFFNLHDLPTEAEVLIMLMRRNFLTQKEIANIRKVSPRTIEKQISSLKDKIKPPFALENILRSIEVSYT